MPFNVTAFKTALSQFATGVAIITARGQDGAAIGLTMSSFNSVSIEPPLILFSVARHAYSLPAMTAARGYAVNVLDREQEHLSDRFARALEDKWGAVEHTLGHAEAPLLRGALAHLECEPYAQYDGGDHVIFVGRVLQCASNPDGQPLVFFRSRYGGVGSQQNYPEWPLSIHY